MWLSDACVSTIFCALKMLPHALTQTTIVRPSGNPLCQQGFDEMMQCGDITFDECSSAFKILELKKVELYAQNKAAFVIFVEHTTFKYKGILNDDCATWYVC